MDLKYCAVIPARGGSKRLLQKNIKLLAGRPLIEYTIRAASDSKRISRIIVTTDDIEIANISRGFNIDILYPRPSELASDTASPIDVLKYVVNKIETDKTSIENVILLQPTSPFRTGRHIDAAIDLFSKSDADTLTSICKVKEHPFWLWKQDTDQIIPVFSMNHIRMDRHKLPQYYIENGAIYIVKKSTLFRQGLYGSNVIPYIMGDAESTDIDDILDIEWAELLISKNLVRFDNPHA
jgi:CMP-N-acetylneuraminic acid synthetase